MFAKQWARPTETIHLPAEPHSFGIAHTKRSLVDLRGQIELHEAVLAALEVILHEQRGVRSKTQLYRTTERSGLCEIHEITQSECCCHGLVHRQGHPLLWPFGLPGLQHDVA